MANCTLYSFINQVFTFGRAVKVSQILCALTDSGLLGLQKVMSARLSAIPN